jgi:photosystem II stability/assembly factor-like uncharacterized protein
MHKAEPGVNWRAIEQYNAKQKWLNLSGTIVRSANSETFANNYILGTWIEKGTFNQTGKFLNCDYDKVSDNLYFISGGGSVWKTPRSGLNWQVVNDKFNFSNVIKLIPLPSAKRRIISAIGNQLVYSDDDGKSFQNSNMDYFYDFGTTGEIEVLNDSATIYYSCRMWSASPFGPNIMLFKSVDRGLSFQRMLTLPDAPINSVHFWKPNNLNAVFFLTQNNGLFKLLTGTTNPIAQATQGLPPASTSSFFGYAKNNSRILYAIQNGDQLYRSTDEGLSWDLVSTLISKAGIAGGSISQVDSAQILFADVEAYRSKDQGKTFALVSSASEYYTAVNIKLHSDITNIKYFKDINGVEFLVISTAGGAYISTNYGEANFNISATGVNNSQYHETRTSPSDTALIYAGSRDQGIQKSTTLGTNGLLGFSQIKSGNYGKMAFALGAKKLFVQAPDGVIDYFSTNTTISNVYPKIPGNYRPNSGWFFPIAENGNTSSNAVFIGGGDLKGGDGSYLIRLQVTDDANIAAIKYITTQFDYDFLANSFDGKSGISAVVVSPVDTNRIYVATADGTCFYSKNRGKTWDKSNGFTGPTPQAFNGSVLYASAVNKETVYMAGSGYSNPAVYRSSDGGLTFTSMGNGLPNTTVYKLTGLPGDSVLLAATESGPYAFVPSQSKWYSLVGANTPLQAYWSVEYIPSLNTARFGTYGRGIWDFRLDAVGNSILASKPVITTNSINNQICSGDSLKLTSSSTTNTQWFLNGVIIDGANKQTYQAKTTGSYTARTNYNTGYLESNPIDVLVTSVTKIPVISTQSALIKCEGDSALFKSDLSSVQWRLNGTNIVAATNEIFQAKKTGTYTAVFVNNSCASAPSNAIKIEFNTVPLKPIITYYQPLDLCDGDSVILFSNILSGFYWVNTLVSDTTPISTETKFTVRKSGKYMIVNNNGKKGCAAYSVPVTITNNSSPNKSVISWNGKELSTQTGFPKYTWYLQNIVLPAFTDYKFVPPSSGFYRVKVVNQAGCSDTSALYNLELPRVWFDGITVKVFPNPAPSEALLEFSETPTTTFYITLITSNGRVLQSFKTKLKTNRLQLSGLAPGMYYIQMDNGKTIGSIPIFIP